MKSIDNSVLERQLRWRYATKKFDSTRRIPQADWATLLNTVNLSPSSFGMQPWRFIVVENSAVREQLRKAAWNQSQVTEASHFIVLAAKRKVDITDIETWMAKISSVRSIPDDSLVSYKQMIHGFVTRPNFDTEVWAAHQVYLSLGVLLTSAAILGIDACPMEGFDAEQFNQILDLPSKGYSAKIACALGYRSAEDEYAGLAKVRYDRDAVITTIS